LVAALAGCASLRRVGLPEDAQRRDWGNTLAAARTFAAGGKFGAADTALADFANRHPGSALALETAYWRALFDLDPSNARASIPTALASLDAYLNDSRPREHLTEATTIRRIAAELDSVKQLAATAIVQAKDANATAANAKAQAADANARAEAAKTDVSTSADAEIKRLRDELAKANSELERIKKRLSQPPPKP
jgi:TolA-binding protein